MFNWVSKSLVLGLVLLQAGVASASGLPPQPADPKDPGSNFYPYKVAKQSFSVAGRTADLFLPYGNRFQGKIPVVVFGRGAGTMLMVYQTMFEHLAAKGIAVIFPEFKDGLGDHDAERQAADYMGLADAVMNKYSQQLDRDKVIFSGHSMGARVALMAAGLPQGLRKIEPHAVIVFDTAGFEDDYLARLNPAAAITLVVGDRDDKTPPSLTQKIYDKIQASRKQMVVMRSYTETNPQVIADHGFVRTYDWTGPRVTPLHYYGSWKFLVGGVWDMQYGSSRVTEPHIYGNLAGTTGLQGIFHQVIRNW